MEDEPIWGHAIRTTCINGLESHRQLKLASVNLPVKQGSFAALGRIDFRYLFEPAGLDYRTYLERHSAASLIQTIGMTRTITALSASAFVPAGYGREPQLPARACACCVEHDKDLYGFSWFRRKHNLAGVVMCDLHGTALSDVGSVLDLRRGARSLALLEPQKSEANQAWHSDGFISRYHTILLWLSERIVPLAGWHQLVALVRERYRAFGLPWDGEAALERVKRQAPGSWLDSHFRAALSTKDDELARHLELLPKGRHVNYYWTLALASLYETADAAVREVGSLPEWRACGLSRE